MNNNIPKDAVDLKELLDIPEIKEFLQREFDIEFCRQLAEELENNPEAELEQKRLLQMADEMEQENKNNI